MKVTLSIIIRNFNRSYELPDAIKGHINDLLADGVVTSGVVVGSILLARNQLLRMKQLAVDARSDLVCREARVSILLRGSLDTTAPHDIYALSVL